MTLKHRRSYRVQFTLEFLGTRRRRTISGVQETPYIFEVVDDRTFCTSFIEAKNPIRAQELAERRIKEVAQNMVFQIAKKTNRKLPNAIIYAKGPDGKFRNSKNFYSISGYRITELLILNA